MIESFARSSSACTHQLRRYPIVRPHPAFALMVLLGLPAAACSAEHAPPNPASPESSQASGLFFDEPLPAVGGDIAAADLTDRLLDSGALSVSQVRLGRRTHLTVVVTNPFDSAIGELKIIIIDNPTTRTFGPTSLEAGHATVFSTFVNSAIHPGRVRVLGSLP